MASLAVLVLALAACTTSATVLDASSLTTFGAAGKAVYLRDGETDLWNHTCAGTLCVLRHMWFGGLPGWSTYNITRLRVYVDGESTPSIDGQFFMLHGIGFDDSAAPWSSGALFGKTGNPSGIFNTYQIPFAKTIRITAQAYSAPATPDPSPKRFWWIFRGTSTTSSEGGVVINGHVLPLTARLSLVVRDSVHVPKYSELSLFSTDKSGLALMTVLAVSSEREQFLEGMVRSYTKGEMSLYSSGTEDYFVGTCYFNRGTYHNPLAGLSHMENAGGWTFSAYRTHIDDMIVFPSGGYNFTWRCGEPGAGSPTDCVASSYALVYLW